MIAPPAHSIVVAAHSEAWCSVIRRKFHENLVGPDAKKSPNLQPPSKLSWLLNTDELLAEAIKTNATVAIVEISTDNIEQTCHSLAPLVNNSYQLKLFAVGDHELIPWQPVLRAAGFSGCYWTLLQTNELVRVVQLHQRKTPLSFRRAEDRIAAQLPWRAATTD